MIKVYCDFCSKEIMRFPRTLKRNKHHFCSPECKADFQKGKPAWNKGTGKVEVECINCSKTFKVSPVRVKRGVRFHSNKCRYEYMVGENAVCWRGGASREPYAFEFGKQLKELIRSRDGYKCQKCGCPEIENNEKLSIHHIDYIKKNCLPTNLTSLCRSCNIKVNSNREYWTNYFRKRYL